MTISEIAPGSVKHLPHMMTSDALQIPVLPAHRVAVLQDICMALERLDQDQKGTILIEDFKDVLRNICSPEEHDDVAALCSKYVDIRPDNRLYFTRLRQVVNSSFSVSAPSRESTADAFEVTDVRHF